MNFDVFFSFLKMIKGKKILDYGCGLPYNAITIALNGFEVIATDIREDVLMRGVAFKEYIEKISGKKLSLKFCKVNELNEKFDAIYCGMVINEIKNSEKILISLKKLLNNNGIILFTTLYQDSKVFQNLIEKHFKIIKFGKDIMLDITHDLPHIHEFFYAICKK